MAHESEYDDALVTLLELIWGEGYMAPGGDGNVAKIAEGLDMRDKRVLEIGCGIGGPAFFLVRNYGANVVGTDLEPQLLELARQRAKKYGLEAKTDFQLVEPGPLGFPDESFDFVISSGAFTQIEYKVEMLKDVLRVLKPGGVFSCYEWMKSEGDYSEDMHYWFKLEGLTYAMKNSSRQRGSSTSRSWKGPTGTARRRERNTSCCATNSIRARSNSSARSMLPTVWRTGAR